MKVLKVIVDELPKSCIECGLARWEDEIGYRFCGAVTRLDNNIDMYADKHERPDWCPLVLLNREVVYELYDKWAVQQLDKESDHQ